jgi:four helix bundle suffix protein
MKGQPAKSGKNTDGQGRARTGDGELIPKHGGYRKLKTFRLAELIYDVTARFCELYINPRSRTHDQMVQAARSGVQNIVEGSQDSGTSKKIGMKLTNIARGSLEELRRDYRDFLRQRGWPEWPPEHPALKRFKALRCADLETFRRWVAQEARNDKNTDPHGRTRTWGRSPTSPCSSVSIRVGFLGPTPPSAVAAANGALSLLNLCCYLLDRQLAAQAEAFTAEGGFTERLYRRRTGARRKA